MPTNCICCACFFVVIIMSYTADKERLQKTLSDIVVKSTLQSALNCSCSALGFYFVCIIHILYAFDGKVLSKNYMSLLRITCVYGYSMIILLPCTCRSMNWFSSGILPAPKFFERVVFILLFL